MHRVLVARSLLLLRWALGLIFLYFGALKLVPGYSPAEGLVMEMTLLHGDEDRSAPLEFIRSLVARMGDRKPPLAMEVTRGDHHLAIRRPDVVARAVADTLGVVT